MKKFLHSLLVLFMGINTVAFAQQEEAATVETWDGSNMEIEIFRGEKLTFEYTATEKGTVYVYADDQSSADYLTVDIWGGVYRDGAYDEVLKLEDTGCFDLDNRTGVHGKIELWEGDKLRFTLVADDSKWAGEATSFTLKSKLITGSVQGGSFENPVVLTKDTKATLATFKNSLELLDETHVTFCSFTAPSDGVASIYAKTYLIYYIEAENFGEKELNEVVESNNTQYEHEFIVKKDQNYLVAVPNSRFVDVTFKMTYDRLGLSAEFPIEISEFPTTLDLVKGDNYYKFDCSLMGSNTLMEVAVAEGWKGNIAYLEGTKWGAVESDELAADDVTGSASTFYKNLDQRFFSYGEAVVMNFNVEDGDGAATLTLREPATGESFETAIPADFGENAFNGPVRDYWFAYTAETDAEYSFATSGTLKHVNLVAGVELMVPDNIYRFHEGETVYVCVATTSGDKDTLTISGNEIVDGDYCDRPKYFELGKELTIEGRGRDCFYSFTAEENGFAVFTSSDWSLHFRSECGGRRIDCRPTITEEGDLEDENNSAYVVTYTYKLPVEEGQSYIVEIEALSETITVGTAYEAAVAGDVCATAIAIETLSDTLKLDYAFGVEKWYQVTAEKDGYFTIYAKLGYASNMKTKVGSCDAAETNAQSDNSHDNAYMGGYKAAKVYVEEGETLYIYIKTGSENDEVQFGKDFYIVPTFAEPRPGENVNIAIQAQESTAYELMANDANGYEQWYTYTIPANKELTITLSAQVKFITSSALGFYKEDKTTSMYAYKGDYTQSNITNEAGEIIGKNYSFAAADAERTIYIKVSTVNAMYLPVVWYIGDAPVVDGIGAPETGVKAPVIYDLMGRRVENPGKGIYIINGVKRVIK